MSLRRVHIDELRLRVSGLTRDEARRLGDAVAKHLRRLPVGNASRSIPNMNIRMQSERTNSIEAVADAIAGNVRRKLV